MSIKNSLEKVLAEYPAAREEGFSQHPLASYICHEMPAIISAACGDSDKYQYKGSAGKGNWARGPWIAVFNPIITTSAQKGFYPVYLFREDMAGVYLSLNQAMTEQKALYKSDAKTVLRAKASNFRAILGTATGRFTDAEINLAPDSQANATAFYEAGNILARYYPKDAIPTDAILKDDLGSALSLYDDLINGETAVEACAVAEGDEPWNIQFEDAGKLRMHKRIERNQKLAQDVKKTLGYKCQACGLIFTDIYGEIGKEYIEAHHLIPISSLKGQKVPRNPKTDFAVLCSNCHRMIHRSAFTGDIAMFVKQHLKK